MTCRSCAERQAAMKAWLASQWTALKGKDVPQATVKRVRAELDTRPWKRIGIK